MKAHTQKRFDFFCGDGNVQKGKLTSTVYARAAMSAVHPKAFSLVRNQIDLLPIQYAFKVEDLSRVIIMRRMAERYGISIWSLQTAYKFCYSTL